MPATDDELNALALRIVRATVASVCDYEESSEVIRDRAGISARYAVLKRHNGFLESSERARAEFVARLLREWAGGRAGGG